MLLMCYYTIEHDNDAVRLTVYAVIKILQIALIELLHRLDFLY